MSSTKITAGFWHDRLEVNAHKAIFHQWDQLEASGCIENFRIAAGEVEGFREGWFFSDSDAYKWLEAASRSNASHPNSRLASLIDQFISLLAKAQMPDGYLYTYNQINFPEVRWQNLQIEHELYCHGHLIEAGIAHYIAGGRSDLINIARHAADRIVEDFRDKGPEFTPGHEEIEIALLHLHQVIEDDTAYLKTARQFLEQRGRTTGFAMSIIQQNSSVAQRDKIVKHKKREYLAAHPDFKPYQLPPGNVTRKHPLATLRWFASALSGKYFQQHTPVRKQSVPVGHSVRFAYLETALALLARETEDNSLVPVLEKAWEHMVMRRMYVTGGIGSLPGLEGFGNDYELDPEYAYAETCAALACLFWNWEMVQLTGKAKYSDLFEWQLYNAAAVGMSLDGLTYFYNNPLSCRGEITRKTWYAIPCCPSNLSRTWADLGKYIFSLNEDGIFIHQYISCETTLDASIPVNIRIESELPWNGKVLIHVNPAERKKMKLFFRLPSWSPDTLPVLHGSADSQIHHKEELQFSQGYQLEDRVVPTRKAHEQPASGFNPGESRFVSSERSWSPEDRIEFNFDMTIKMCHAHPKVKGHQNKVALTRGPLVYCLENIDNPNVDIFNSVIDTSSVRSEFDETLLGGIIKIEARTKDGQAITFIPYHLWGNRGCSQMTVWVKA
ncbi:MAG: beta-L-arabinofuranosidase domain-containing protein [Chloroflexota bacterium]